MIKPYNKGRISYVNVNFKHHKNFVTSGKEQAEMFINVIEESYKNRLVRTSVVVKFIKGENELQELLRFRKMNVNPDCLRLQNCSPDFHLQKSWMLNGSWKML